jgi:hypothetical protein
MTRYARAPSRELTGLLGPGGSLSPLLAPRVVAGVALDVHLRERDHVNVYCGGTVLVDAWLSRDGRVQVSAGSGYRSQDCAVLLSSSWRVDEPQPVLRERLDHYLAHVSVSPKWAAGEYAVQASWTVRAPWLPFDREGVLGYPSRLAKTNARDVPAVRAARAEAGRPRVVGHYGAEVDQLAIDPAGHLVLIELKDAGRVGNQDSVVDAPLQLLQYLHEWANALDTVRDQIARVVRARIEVGLSPPETPTLTGGIRPVLAFGTAHPKSSARGRLDAVRDVANRHLPIGTSPIELWAMDHGGPVRLG